MLRFFLFVGRRAVAGLCFPWLSTVCMPRSHQLKVIRPSAPCCSMCVDQAIKLSQTKETPQEFEIQKEEDEEKSARTDEEVKPFFCRKRPQGSTEHEKRAHQRSHMPYRACGFHYVFTTHTLGGRNGGKPPKIHLGHGWAG